MARPNLAIGILVGSLALVATSLGLRWSGASAATVTVNTRDTFQGSVFDPAQVTIAVGDTVTWVNAGFGIHTTTSRTGLWSDDLFPGDSFSFTFDTPGVYDYICVFHDRAGMVGSVTVNAGSPSPTATPTILAPTSTPTSPPPTSTPTVAPTGTTAPTTGTPSTCALATQGDANCDGRFTLSDYTIWRNQFLGIDPNRTADFNGDGRITLTDYTIWRNSFLAS